MSEEKKMTLRDTIVPKSDQLNYDDFLAGPQTLRVTGLKMGTPEQPVIVSVAALDGTPMRDYKPCKGMRRVLIQAWGDKGINWKGKLLTLCGNASVRFGAEKVGGIQVSAVSGITEPMICKLTVSRGKRSDYVVQPIADGAQTKPVDPDVEAVM